VNGKYVIAWYCIKAQSNDAIRASQFIGYPCFDKGYNECYNTLALKEVNKLRNNHDVAALKLNVRAARELDFQLIKTEPGKLLLPQPKNRGYNNRGCYQSVFLQNDQKLVAQVSTTNAAVKYWYEGVGSYDYNTNKPKVPSPQQIYVEEANAC